MPNQFIVRVVAEGDFDTQSWFWGPFERTVAQDIAAEIVRKAPTSEAYVETLQMPEMVDSYTPADWIVEAMR